MHSSWWIISTYLYPSPKISHSVYSKIFLPAVSQHPLCDVLGPWVPEHRPLCLAAAVRVDDILGPLPLVDPPPRDRLLHIDVEGDISRGKVGISEWLFTLKEKKMILNY